MHWVTIPRQADAHFPWCIFWLEKLYLSMQLSLWSSINLTLEPSRKTMQFVITALMVLLALFILSCCYRALVLGITFLLDRWMYGSWIFVPLNFLKFNFFSSGGDYYGTHKWHWYFTQGFPVMLFTFIPFTVVGIYHSKEWKLFGLIAWALGLYSMLGHKEFRYVHVCFCF